MTYKWWSPLYFKLFCLFHAITKPCDRNKNDIYMCYNWGFKISTIFKYSFLLFCSFTGSSVGNWLSMTWQLFSLWKLESAVSCTVKTLITKSQRWAMLFRVKVIRYILQLYNRLLNHGVSKSLCCMRQFIIGVFAVTVFYCFWKIPFSKSIILYNQIYCFTLWVYN